MVVCKFDALLGEDDLIWSGAADTGLSLHGQLVRVKFSSLGSGCFHWSGIDLGSICLYDRLRI